VNAIVRRFYQFDGPTLLVALIIYASWFGLIWFNASLPWWVIVPVGAYLIAWQFSLQHEAIHAFRGIPGWLRLAIVFPPLGLWFPFPLYRKSHSTHHRDPYLTVPGEDTEAYYVTARSWQSMGRIERGLLIFNQTLLGRLLIGPPLRLWKLATREIGRVRGGDTSHLPHWAVHVVGVAILFGFVSGICKMPWWQYVLLIAYPGMSLGLLRAFIEHRAAEAPGHRTASVESNAFFSLLFLYNNLHVAHHLKPTLPWYEIPRFYQENKPELLSRNDNFTFPGYGRIAWRYFIRPVFHPAHPIF
jgi:fatty acid desaturase